MLSTMGIPKRILAERKAAVLELLIDRYSTEIGKKVKLNGQVFGKKVLSAKVYTILDYKIEECDFKDIRTGKQTAMFSIRLSLKSITRTTRWSVKFPVHLRPNEIDVIFPKKEMQENYFEDGSLL